jgi:hypothetical protein
MSSKPSSLFRPQTGAVLVEFAIIVPFLLIMVIGIVEFGYAYYHLNILNKSVQDSARYFSDPLIARNGNKQNPIDANFSNEVNGDTVDGTNKNKITTAKNLVIYGKLSPGDDDSPLLPDASNYDPEPEIFCTEEGTSNTICAEGTEHITITASYNHHLITSDFLSNLLSIFYSGNGGSIGPVIPFKASSTMRVQ